MNAVIAELYIYPVKSLAGIKVNQAKLTESGLEGDRQWAIFTASGHMLTQRQDPRLALIQPEITAEGLILHAPGMQSIQVTNPSCKHVNSPPSENFAPQPLTIWRDQCWGHRADPAANQWLTEFLQAKQVLTLYKAAAESSRQFINPARFSTAGNYFSDAAPYLIASQSSLNSLNAHLVAQQLPAMGIRNFRPNIVIADVNEFAEQNAQFLEIEPALDSSEIMRLKIVDHCQRCLVISVDPDKGEYQHSTDYIKAVAQWNPMPQNIKAPAFGMNCSLECGAGLAVRVGQNCNLISLSR